MYEVANLKSEIERTRKEIDLVLKEQDQVKVKIEDGMQNISEFSAQKDEIPEKLNERIQSESKDIKHLSKEATQRSQNLKMLERICGYKCIQHTKNTKKFLFPTKLGSKANDLIITIHFDAKNSIKDVDMDETMKCEEFKSSILKKAIELNSVDYLLIELCTYWLKYHDLFAEIKNIMQSFAVDWQGDEKKLLVMLGNGKIICSLVLSDDFSKTGEIHLKNIEGMDVDVKSLKPPQEKPSLTEWVEYLKKHIEGNVE